MTLTHTHTLAHTRSVLPTAATSAPHSPYSRSIRCFSLERLPTPMNTGTNATAAAAGDDDDGGGGNGSVDSGAKNAAAAAVAVLWHRMLRLLVMRSLPASAG